MRNIFLCNVCQKFCKYCLFLILTFILLQNESLAFQKGEDVPKTNNIDITSEGLDGRSIRLFTNTIFTKNENVGVAEGNVFGFTEEAVFSANKIEVNKLTGDLFLQDNVKIRTNQDLLLYAPNAEFNQKTQFGKFNDVHIFFADNSSALIKNLGQNSDDIYEMNDVTFSACYLNGILDVNMERERRATDYVKSQAIFNPRNLNTTVNHQYCDVEKQYSDLPWSIQAEKMTLNTKTEYATIYGAKIKAFGIPLFKIHEYSTKINNEEGSGFLKPEIILMGKRQIGIGIPYYLRISNRSDLIIKPSFYQDITGLGLAKTTSKPTATMDSKRLRENTLDFRYRYLLQEAKEGEYDESKIEIETSATDKTYLINPVTRLYKTNENGDIVTGNRWFIDTKFDYNLSKEVHIKGALFKVSDPNFLTVYHLEKIMEMYARNFLSINKVNQDMYHMAEIMTFSPLLIYSSPLIRPTSAPHLISIFEQKLGNIPGRFLLGQRYVDLQRDTGYSSQIYNGELGYTLPIKTKNWNYFNFFGSSKFDWQDSKYQGFSDGNSPFANGMKRASYYSNENSRLGYYGYLNNIYGDYKMNRTYYNISADFATPIFTGIGRFGQFVFEPRIKYKQSPNNVATPSILEDSLSTQIQRANLFSNSLSSGYGVVDYGKRLAYGVDGYTKIPWYNTNISASIGMSTYIGSVNNQYQAYNGFSGSFSDYVGNIKLSNKYFTFYHEYRIPSDMNTGIATNIISPEYHSTGIGIINENNINATGFMGNIAYTTINSMPYGETGSIKSMAPKLSYRFSNGLNIGGMGIRVIENTTTQNVDAWLMQELYAIKETNCLFYGLSYMTSNYPFPGMPSVAVIRFKFGVKGMS